MKNYVSAPAIPSYYKVDVDPAQLNQMQTEIIEVFCRGRLSVVCSCLSLADVISLERWLASSEIDRSEMCKMKILKIAGKPSRIDNQCLQCD